VVAKGHVENCALQSKANVRGLKEKKVVVMIMDKTEVEGGKEVYVGEKYASMATAATSEVFLPLVGRTFFERQVNTYLVHAIGDVQRLFDQLSHGIFKCAEIHLLTFVPTSC